MQAANIWGERIPEPFEAFNNRVINPANLALEARRRDANLLDKKTLRTLTARRDALRQALTGVGFFAANEQFQRLMHQQRNLADALEGAVNDSREPLQAELARTLADLRALTAEFKPFVEAHREYKDIAARLQGHVYAVQRAEYDRRLNEEMASEAQYFEQLIIDRWAALGYKHDTLWRNKRVVHKVSFRTCHITGDAIWFKVNTAQKTMGRNWKTMLPQGVHLADLISERTLFELSQACGRQVTAHIRNNGTWVKVNRLDSVDGLMTRVTYEQVMRHYPQQDRQFLPVPMGVGEGRNISWVHITAYPHILIGGSTGTGKSNIENVILNTIIEKHSPAEVQLVLIDLKEGLEFQEYERIPHLLMPFVTTIDDAAEVLLQLEALRADRGKMLAEARVKNIDEYNTMAALKKIPRLPRVIVMFDEFAAIDNPFMRDQQKSILASVMQLTNKARAVGIHLILCTQTPEVSVVPGTIKNNMSFRIAGQMPTASASITILGVGDAANLPLVPGRMMAMAGSLKWQLQTPLIDKADIEAGIKAAMRHAALTMDVSTPKIVLPEATGSLGFGEDDLLAMVMEDYGGALKYIHLWEQLKDTGVISQGPLREMIKRVKAWKTFEYEGKTYRWKTLPGNIAKAVLVKDDNKAGESAPAEPAVFGEEAQDTAIEPADDIVTL